MLPSITCICPTYGRPKLLANAVACFLAQDYPRHLCKLVISDDLGTIRGLCINDLTDAAVTDNPTMIEVENVSIYSTTHRYSSLPEKYNVLWRRLSLKSDIYVVWEDDDCQLPWCLKSHANACEHHGWSQPSHVWSDYGGDLHTEPVAGRFHGSLAIRHDVLVKIEGWPATRRADFDQRLIKALYDSGKPGDPLQHSPSIASVRCEPNDPRAALRAANPLVAHEDIVHGRTGLPAYVFRWHTGQEHGQSGMQSPEDEGWYDRYQPPDRNGPNTIIPAMDADSKKFYDLLT